MLATTGANGKVMLWNLNLEEMLGQVLRDRIHHQPNITQRVTEARCLCDGIGG